MGGIHSIIFRLGRPVPLTQIGNRLGPIRARWLNGRNVGADIRMEDVGSTIVSGQGRSAFVASVNGAAKLNATRGSGNTEVILWLRKGPVRGATQGLLGSRVLVIRARSGSTRCKIIESWIRPRSRVIPQLEVRHRMSRE